MSCPCITSWCCCLNQVKRHRHENLSLHGAGKHLAKGEASRILRHLVIEDFLAEDVKKSDFYGSVSSVLKVLVVFQIL
jgi:bloom syndrome protein